MDAARSRPYLLHRCCRAIANGAQARRVARVWLDSRAQGCRLPRRRCVQALDALKWDEQGLVVAIAQNADTGAVMMQAFANRDAVAATLRTGKARAAPLLAPPRCLHSLRSAAAAALTDGLPRRRPRSGRGRGNSCG